MLDGYMSIKEAAEKWEISTRRVQVLCTEGRIRGAAKLGREWAIPLNSEKPIDKRVRSGQYRNWRKNEMDLTEERVTDNLAQVKNSYDDFDVEFEVAPVVIPSKSLDERQLRILQGQASIEEQLNETQNALDVINTDISIVTNSADGLDYTVAVASGIITGILDVVFIDDFSLENANVWGIDKTNQFVIKIAQSQGYKESDLYGAVKFLEEKFPLAADKATNDFGGGLQHHLRDFSHHPTPIGLVFSLLTQFTGNVYGTDVAGVFQVVPLSEKGLLLVGKNFPEKITFGVINWFFHMVSDMAGSSSSVLQGKIGTGLPGPLVSLLKEVSALPLFRKMNDKGYKEFSVWISKLFNGTLLGERDENNKLIPLKFDLRTEIGVSNQLSQQTIPIVINESIVRGFYFVRHLVSEIKQSNIKSISDIMHLNWKNTLPFKNRTIIRMLTISTGTMTAIDLADASVEAAIKSGGINPVCIPNLIVKVNFVGMGRLAVAVSSDSVMGIKRSKLRTQRIIAMNEQIYLMNGRTYYKQAGMWLSAESAGQTINEAYALMDTTAKEFALAYADINEDVGRIRKYMPKVKEKNADLVSNMRDILKWGN